jgi:hypothetical protein
MAMDRNQRINRLVNRKLAAGAQAMGCVPCFGIAVPRQSNVCASGAQRPAQAPPNK